MVLINRIRKGGGPYGAGVTRGQDLSGKDFSGRTLIKQDFKTVCIFEIYDMPLMYGDSLVKKCQLGCFLMPLCSESSLYSLLCTH